MTVETLAKLHTASRAMRETQQALNQARAADDGADPDAAEILRRFGRFHDELRLLVDAYIDETVRRWNT